MNDKLAGMISRVQKLINQAEYAETQGYVSASGERDNEAAASQAANYRTMAERIMREYRIEEEQLIATDQFASVPVMHSIFACGTWSDFSHSYYMLMHWIAQHCGVEFVRRGYREGEDAGTWFDLFGYEGDLRAAEWLWSSARLVFGQHLEPVIDPAAGDQVNAYLLRRAGILRKDIARKLWGFEGNTAANRSRAQRLYVAECKVRGEQPSLTGRGSDAEMYRTGYAESFVSRLNDRLRRSRDAVDSTGGAVVLAGRRERVLEAVYAVYPSRRPKPRTEVAKVTPNAPAKVDRRRKDWTQADERRYQRRLNASAMAGRNAGEVAASKVEMTPRDHTPASRVDAAPLKAVGWGPEGRDGN